MIGKAAERHFEGVAEEVMARPTLRRFGRRRSKRPDGGPMSVNTGVAHQSRLKGARPGAVQTQWSTSGIMAISRGLSRLVQNKLRRPAIRAWARLRSSPGALLLVAAVAVGCGTSSSPTSPPPHIISLAATTPPQSEVIFDLPFVPIEFRATIIVDGLAASEAASVETSMIVLAESTAGVRVTLERELQASTFQAGQQTIEVVHQVDLRSLSDCETSRLILVYTVRVDGHVVGSLTATFEIFENPNSKCNLR